MIKGLIHLQDMTNLNKDSCSKIALEYMYKYM